MRAHVFLGGLAVGTLVLAACSSRSVLPEAQIDLPGQYSRLAPVPQIAASDVQWWRGFHDPVLDRLVAQGLAENVTLRIAEARLAEAAANGRAAGNRVSDALSATLEDNDGRATATGGLSVSLAPFGGRNRHEAAAALARLQAARYGQQGARLTLLSTLTGAYVDLRYYQALLRQQELDLASRKKTLQSLTAQVGLGAATRLDTLSAEALVVETEARIPQLNANVARQGNRISTLLGMPAGALGIALDYPGHQPVLARPKGIGIPADLVRRRPDIREAERLYAAAVADVGKAEAAFYPSLSLSGQISAPLDSAIGTSHALTVGVSLPLLGRPRLKAEQDAAHARADQAYLGWRLTVLTAVEDVESGLAAVAGSRLAASRAGRVVSLNAEALDLSRKLLESNGDVTALDLLDRERSISQARAALAQNQRDYAIDTIRLYVALGLGPDPEGR